MNVCRALVLSLAVAGFASSALADITGSVKLDGPIPTPKQMDMSTNPDCAKLHPDPVDDDTVVVNDKGNLQNVIVSIKPADGQDLGGEAPKDVVYLDQEACMYTPHVVALMAGQELRVKNSDDFMHNVHSLPEENNPVNQAQPRIDKEGIKIKPTEPETFMIKCDVHPWMKAWVGVFDHPFFAVSDEDGKFSIKTDGLKDGDYTLQAWHEKFGTTTQKVTVKGGKATADFKVKQDDKADAGQSSITATAQVTAAGQTDAECKECCSTVSRASLAAKAAK
jgi:plastocyanin